MKKVFDIKPGDTVWVMHNNIAVSGTVVKIWYTKFISPVDYETIGENELYYVSANGKKIGDYTRKEIFNTKEDLLKSL